LNLYEREMNEKEEEGSYVVHRGIEKSGKTCDDLEGWKSYKEGER